jgi:superfamily II DNA or RNA helicase
MNLYPHQQRFLDEVQAGTNKKILAHEVGTGKSLCGILWLKEQGKKMSLVVCPKQIKRKWEDDLKLHHCPALVLTKEEFKKFPLKAWEAIVIDEADQFASPLYSKGRSQLTTRMYEVIKQFNPQVLGLTATPIRSKPENLHTLLTLTGKYIEWKDWRNRFMELKKTPYMPRPAWLPKAGWRKDIRPVLEKYADIVLMKDCVDFLPEVTEKIIKVKKDPFINTEWEGIKAFFEEHKHEQKHKAEKVKEIGKGYRKVVVVAYYVEQVEELAKKLSEDRETFYIHGGVKNQEKVIKDAQESDECYLVIQAGIGAGFDLDTFAVMIFASMSYAVREFVQMCGRIRRIKNLHPVKYFYLIAGEGDLAIKKNVELGKDFIPSLWKTNATRTTKTK